MYEFCFDFFSLINFCLVKYAIYPIIITLVLTVLYFDFVSVFELSHLFIIIIIIFIITQCAYCTI